MEILRRAASLRAQSGSTVTKASHAAMRREAGHSLARGSPQGGGWQLAEKGAIVGCKTPKAAELVAPNDGRYACRIGVSVAQRAMHQLHPPTEHILDRVHAELFLAANAQAWRRHAERRADFGHPKRPLRLSFQQSLEADREILVSACGGHNLDRRAFRETLD